MGELAKIINTFKFPPRTVMRMNYFNARKLKNALKIQFTGLANMALDVFHDVHIRNEFDFKTIRSLSDKYEEVKLIITEVKELLNIVCLLYTSDAADE